MLFNQTNNYKSFIAIKELWLTTVFLLSAVLLSFTVTAAGESDGINNNELVGISYNTIQSDQVVLVFSFAQNIISLPEVKTSMTPAFVEVTFDPPWNPEMISDEARKKLGVGVSGPQERQESNINKEWE